jgi:hypothetical protein
MTTQPITPAETRDLTTFWTLREAPLHELSEAQWRDYYPAMAPWLTDSAPEIRDCALERLMMAVFRAEFCQRPREDHYADAARARMAWLLAEVDRTNIQHPDTIPNVLDGLRYHGDDEPFRTPLLAWLDELRTRQLDGVDDGVVLGTRMIVAGVRHDNLNRKLAEWVSLLDHPSNYVRACAAHQLGNYSCEDTEPTRDALFDVMRSKEIARPGVAGPFWSPQHCFESDGANHNALWMIEMLEQRIGPAPSNMPYNDIDFYLHELCCYSPDLMRRMLAGGFDELALMTATEMHEPVVGVQPILEELAAHARPEIAAGAQRHLAAHYGKS